MDYTLSFAKNSSGLIGKKIWELPDFHMGPDTYTDEKICLSVEYASADKIKIFFYKSHKRQDQYGKNMPPWINNYSYPQEIIDQIKDLPLLEIETKSSNGREYNILHINGRLTNEQAVDTMYKTLKIIINYVNETLRKSKENAIALENVKNKMLDWMDEL